MSLITLVLLFGCGSGIHYPLASGALHGSVHGGQQAISGSLIQLYAVGTTGNGSPATPLISQDVRTDDSGNFDITGLYTCPTSDSVVYLVARGGHSAQDAGPSNPSIGLLAALGPCGALPGLASVSINEVTTVASIWPLAPYAKTSTQIGFASESAYQAVGNDIDSLANIATGIAPGPMLGESDTAPVTKIDTLANILAACIDSNGGTAGDATPCGQLFSYTTFGSDPPPSDTIAASIALAQNPTRNVAQIFELSPATSQFQPILTSAPSDWTLPISSTPSAPVFSIGSGSYPADETVGMEETTSGASIYYTTDDSVPNASSTLYAGPVTVAHSMTLRAVAVKDALVSAQTSATYTINSVSLSLAPGSVTLAPSQTQLFTAVVSGAANPAVTWTLSPAIGSLSPSGLYTAPALIAIPQTVTITATSISDKTKTASSSVALAPQLSLALSLANPTLPVGSSLTGTVTLNSKASTNLSIALSSTSPGTVSLSPSIVNVSIGQSVATFTYTGVAEGTATITAAANGSTSASAQVTTIPPSIPASFFGMTVKDYGSVSPPLQFGTTRTWDASPTLSWSDINPAAGVYNFTGLDNFIATNQARNAQIIYTFGRTPQWASSNPNIAATYGPGQCAPPSDLGVWDAYVKAIVTHAAGRIKYWELWNEPNNPGFYCGDMPTLVTMSQHAWQIIKSIDPTATVLAPPMTSTTGPMWLGDFLFLGGAKYIDAIAFHGYSSTVAEDIIKVIANYRAVMAANGVANKPLWDTEASWAGDGDLTTPNTTQQVGFIPKYYLLHWSLGVPRFVWYAYDGGNTWGGLQTSTGGPSVAATAFGETYRWTVGASLTAPCSQDQSAVWTCGLARQGNYAAEVIWHSSASLSVPVPVQYTEYRDLAGGVHAINNHTVVVGDQPILLETAALP